VAMMARIGGGTVKTFSIGFSARKYDVTRYARMVAQRYATEHQELVVEPDAAAVLRRVVWHYANPLPTHPRPRPITSPRWRVERWPSHSMAMAETSVLFGYNRYRAMHLELARTGLKRLLALMARSAQRRLKVPRIRGVLQAFEEHPLPPLRPYDRSLHRFRQGRQPQWIDGGAARRLGDRSPRTCFTETDSLVSAANWADLHTYLPDDLMVKADVTSMARGLEARSPLLDHVLMEWAAGIPA
jgi:asparagine synthase (glutamine-hydrolysing)